jgi:hypothetical protein
MVRQQPDGSRQIDALGGCPLGWSGRRLDTDGESRGRRCGSADQRHTHPTPLSGAVQTSHLTCPFHTRVCDVTKR